jgi:SAM-dependent methyltransferase
MQASADGYIEWRSADAVHTDRQHFSKIDFWRDILPGGLGEQLQELAPGTVAEVDLAPGGPIPEVDASAIYRVRRQLVKSALKSRHLPDLQEGRFYPRGLLADCTGLSGIFRQDPHPFRVSGADHEYIKADLNHPLAGYPLRVGARVDRFLGVREERGGHCNDIVSDIAEMGPGMQSQPGRPGVSLIHQHAFDRMDSSEDAGFYQTPRLVHHVDSQARAFISRSYQRFIKPHMRILDLMSSWASHLDGVPGSVEVTGLGMNEAELAANPRLADSLLQDLNQQPCLPFADASFDVVICSVSVEYLVRPLEVFAEVGRVLKPGGRFIITFSDRWFPPKVIQLWTELHPFERMALVLEYFRHSGQFSDLATESWRGWPRPADDKYSAQRSLADPVFSVRGTRCP